MLLFFSRFLFHRYSQNIETDKKCLYRFKYKPIDEEQRGDPVRQEHNNLWQCPVCFLPDVPELKMMWEHFDADCPGKCTGVDVKLENNITGTIFLGDISSSGDVVNPSDRMKIGQVVTARITTIRFEYFGVRLTTKSTDLQDEDGRYKVPDDDSTDQERKKATLDLYHGKKVDPKKKAQYIKV